MQEWTTIPAVIRRHLLSWIIASAVKLNMIFYWDIYKSRFSDYVID